ncbi:hypothetical protein [Microseira wollei]|uniref:hypothetical protein n=1 Tax=Microseira wollei TaxID=467598 RepID=UPI001CFD9FEA|nr:hypothetical protein [Microseira wollei]
MNGDRCGEILIAVWQKSRWRSGHGIIYVVKLSGRSLAVPLLHPPVVTISLAVGARHYICG